MEDAEFEAENQQSRRELITTSCTLIFTYMLYTRTPSSKNVKPGNFKDLTDGFRVLLGLPFLNAGYVATWCPPHSNTVLSHCKADLILSTQHRQADSRPL